MLVPNHKSANIFNKSGTLSALSNDAYYRGNIQNVAAFSLFMGQ